MELAFLSIVTLKCHGKLVIGLSVFVFVLFVFWGVRSVCHVKYK